MIEKEFNNRISTKSTAKREKYATFMLHSRPLRISFSVDIQ